MVSIADNGSISDRCSRRKHRSRSRERTSKDRHHRSHSLKSEERRRRPKCDNDNEDHAKHVQTKSEGRSRSRSRRRSAASSSDSSVSSSSLSSSSESSCPRSRRKKHNRKRSKRKKRSKDERRRKEKRRVRKKEQYSDEENSHRHAKKRKKDRRQHHRGSDDDSEIQSTDEKDEIFNLQNGQEIDFDGKTISERSVPAAIPPTSGENKKSASAASNTQSKGPMTQQQYQQLQSQIREVIDPHTGRKRLVRGTGEIIERIVSREEHLALNQKATLGDGRGFAMDIARAAMMNNKGNN